VFVSFCQIYCLIYISIQAHYVPRLNNELVHKHDIHIFLVSKQICIWKTKGPLSLFNLPSHKVVIVCTTYFNITILHFQYDSQNKHIDFHFQLKIFLF